MTDSSLAFALVLTAALCHATWNLVLKKAGNTSLGFVGLLASIETLVWLPVAFVASDLSPILTPVGLTAVAVSAVLHIAYFWLLTGAYGQSDLGVAYPIARATGPFLSGLFAIVVLMERPRPEEWLGACAIIVGSLLIGFSQGRQLSREDWWRGMRLALLCGVTIAAYTVWDQQAVKHWGLPVLAFYWGQLVIRAFICMPWMVNDSRRLRADLTRQWRSLLLIAVFSPLAYQLVLKAMTLAPLSLVAPLRETSILFAILLGSLFLKERNTGRRLLGAGFMVLGLALITL
jgi:drug/metabolite transporter (DMT)-like permease